MNYLPKLKMERKIKSMNISLKLLQHNLLFSRRVKTNSKNGVTNGFYLYFWNKENSSDLAIMSQYRKYITLWTVIVLIV